MSANRSSLQKSFSVAARLERKPEKIKAAKRKKFLNENIVRLEKNGDLSCEAIRTSAVTPGSGVISGDPASITNDLVPELTPDPLALARTAPADYAQNPADPNLLPNKLPETPESHENGNLFADSAEGVAVFCEAKHSAQTQSTPSLTSNDTTVPAGQELSPNAGISCHEAENSGNQIAGPDPGSSSENPDPLEDLLHRALVATKTRRGRPTALDEQAKGQLIALLSVGMSMRQAAAILGVSHTTVQKTLKADPALAEDITAARFQAQLQPLACVIREARRSWKAATWLLKYLDAKIASHEETPDERRQRQQREAEELFARANSQSSTGQNVKTRHVLG